MSQHTTALFFKLLGVKNGNCDWSRRTVGVLHCFNTGPANYLMSQNDAVSSVINSWKLFSAQHLTRSTESNYRMFAVNLCEPQHICTVASASVRDRYLHYQNIEALELFPSLSSSWYQITGEVLFQKSLRVIKLTLKLCCSNTALCGFACVRVCSL